jgi:hypothetical protein
MSSVGGLGFVVNFQGYTLNSDQKIADHIPVPETWEKRFLNII